MQMKILLYFSLDCFFFLNYKRKNLKKGNVYLKKNLKEGNYFVQKSCPDYRSISP